MLLRPALAGATLAVTLELLPERIDLIGFVLQMSGLGSLTALSLSVAFGADEAAFAKYGTLLGAYTGLGLFLMLLSLELLR